MEKENLPSIGKFVWFQGLERKLEKNPIVALKRLFNLYAYIVA